MSEYQHVIFQAVDRPLDDKQLAYARQQSSRAEVSRWSFAVEYHYSSFRGNVDGLLRRGYDVYLQYTSYGCREVRLRLPHGMPVADSLWAKYINRERLCWKPDPKGHGGILTLFPFHDSMEYDFGLDPQEYLDSLIRLRERLIVGDLRALYLLWLCAAYDDNFDWDELIEPPVPHGIAELAADGTALLEFFWLDPLIIAAAGRDIPSAPTDDSQDHPARWVNSLGAQAAKDLLLRLLTGDTPSEKAQLLAEIRDAQPSESWPTSDKQRSFGELLRQTETLRAEEDAKQARKAKARAKREAAKAERARAERMKQMKQNPDKWLGEAERLVDARGTDNYKAAAEILADLREAIGGKRGDKLSLTCAADLTKKYPTLTRLKGSLRKRGLLES